MDFFEALRVIRRRWLATLIGFLLTMSAGVVVLFVVPTNHQASGQLVLLLPPDAVPANGRTNPFLNLDAGLSFVGSLIISSVTTKQTERDMMAAGFTSDYSVAMTPGAGPVLTVTVEDSDAARALNTRSEVIRRLELALDELQPASRVPRNQLITALPNAVSAIAEPLPGDKLRALAVVGVVGLALTLVWAFARDRRLRVRAERRRAVPVDELPEPEDETLVDAAGTTSVDPGPAQPDDADSTPGEEPEPGPARRVEQERLDLDPPATLPAHAGANPPLGARRVPASRRSVPRPRRNTGAPDQSTPDDDHPSRVRELEELTGAKRSER